MGYYIEQNLIKDEEVIYEGKIHWSIWVAPLIWAVIFAIPLVTIPVSLIILLWTLLRVKGTEIAITNKRIIAKRGILSKHTLELNLQKIETVSVNQGIIARLFGSGSIIIKGTGGTSESFSCIAEPFEFRKKFQEALD